MSLNPKPQAFAVTQAQIDEFWWMIAAGDAHARAGAARYMGGRLGQITGGRSLSQFLALSEVERMDVVRRAGFVPGRFADVVPVAPARGAVKVVTPAGQRGGGSEGVAYLGSARLERADVFDVMTQQVLRRGGPAPFTQAQVKAGRDYRALVERYHSAGLRGSSFEARTDGGGGKGGEVMDAVLADGQEVAAVRKRIGAGSAMVLRRTRPSARGTRSGISDRALVDMVCLQDRSLFDVLAAHGWVGGKNVGALRVALCLCLDRMAWTGRGGITGLRRFAPLQEGLEREARAQAAR